MAQGREHLLRRRGPTGELSRRQFLTRGAGAALAVPSLGAILAACGKPEDSATGGGETGGGGETLAYARPDNPVTLPTFDDNPAIEDGLQPETGATLKIYNWADYMWKKVINEFCEEYDCDYEWTTFNNMAEAVQKMSTGQVADVFFPTIDVLAKLTASKLLQPINKSYVPNLEANMWPQYMNPFYDQGAQYTVPYTTYTTGVGYRRDRVDDAEAAEKGYDLLWDPTYAGEIGIYDDSREALGMAMLRAGVTDINTGDQGIIDTARDDLLEMIETVNARLSINGAYVKLPAGDISVHQAWSGDMIGAQWYLSDLKTPGTTDVLGYWFPPDGIGAVGNDTMTIPATAEHPVLAHLFLNWILDEGHGFDNFTWNGYQPPMNSMNPDELIQAGPGEYAPNTGPGTVPPTLDIAVVRPDVFDTGVWFLELSPEDDIKWQTAWQQVKA